MAYRKRIADSLLEFKLESKGAVVIEGAKWCGKTTTAEQVAKSILYMDDPKRKTQNLNLAELDPEVLLEGDTPRLIDEWQKAPSLWDTVRFVVDHRGKMGQFILTGSAVPPRRDATSHSGTGRITKLKMRPMSLYESEESNGAVSLSQLFDEPSSFRTSQVKSLNLNDIAFIICRGGWPMAIDQKGDIALAQAKDYLDVVVSDDISRYDNVLKNENKARAILRSYARNIGTPAPNTTILADIANFNEGVGEISAMNTLTSYLAAFNGIFVLEDVIAWNPNLRSKTAMRSSDVRYFTDPSIAAAALRIGPHDLIQDLETMGFFFENLCIRDLRIFAEAIDGDIYHYRDKTGLECDAVVHLRNGKYGLIEIKLGGEERIKEGIKNLNTLEAKIDTTKMPVPSFKMILTAIGDYAYKEGDTLIVPIGGLGI